MGPDAEEEDEEEIEDEDVMYQPGYEGMYPSSSRLWNSADNSKDEETGMPDPPWGWDQDEDEGMPLPRIHHHHHHPRRIPSPWSILPTGGPGDRGMIKPHTI